MAMLPDLRLQLEEVKCWGGFGRRPGANSAFHCTWFICT